MSYWIKLGKLVIHMKYRYKISKIKLQKTLITTLIICIIFGGMQTPLTNTAYISKASSDYGEWNTSIKINKSNNLSCSLYLGETPDASDGQDLYDAPIPPPSPNLPYIWAWFDTSLDPPFNKLLQEYKKYPDKHKVWNLSVEWKPEAGNESSTNIDISWDPSILAKSEYESIVLQDGDIIVSDMLTENSYTFNSLGNIPHSFKIVCQSDTSDVTTDSNEISPLPLFFAAIVVIILVLIFFYLKKTKT